MAKALGLESWAFGSVEVVATGGAPEVRLGGAAAERAGELGAGIKLSLTHSRLTAGAVAVASSS